MWQKIKNIYHLLQAFLAALFFNFPSRKINVIAVTGTDGKTTTASMIFHILKSSGFKTSIISSVSAQIGNESFDTGFHVTTPSPWKIQKFLKKAETEGSDFFVLEATSHGLDQNRLAFTKIKIAALTNITQEHLDYHKTWENYAKAKLKLFKNVDFSVLNKDDGKSFAFLKDRVGGEKISYSLKKEADITLSKFPVRLKLGGGYNISNALAAAGVCTSLGLQKKKILNALSSFEGVKGRLEEVKLGQKHRFFIDFAHTPNSIGQVLSHLKELKPKDAKLITVFGSAGERDVTKRPFMGKAASESADLIILTSEDPRKENAKEIARQISKGITNGTVYKIIEDRKKAIEFAVSQARPNDIVVTLGKGHEKSMCFGKKEFPWDEFKTAAEAIKKNQNEK